MPNRVTVDEAMLISAVRYALPRLTYMPSWTVDEVIRVWDNLSERARSVITRDVSRELADSSFILPDFESWNRLLQFIDAAADLPTNRKANTVTKGVTK